MHEQYFGISQECQLTPFPFIMIMTVLLEDANEQLLSECGINLSQNMVCHELVYADDTLLIDSVASNLQAYMDCIAACGRTYGLQLNWKKVEK